MTESEKKMCEKHARTHVYVQKECNGTVQVQQVPFALTTVEDLRARARLRLRLRLRLQMRAMVDTQRKLTLRGHTYT